MTRTTPRPRRLCNALHWLTIRLCTSASRGMRLFLRQVDVLTQHNDVARTGANLREIAPTPRSANQTGFGLLFKRAVGTSCTHSRRWRQASRSAEAPGILST